MLTARQTLLDNLRRELHFAEEGTPEEARLLKAVDQLSPSYDELVQLTQGSNIGPRCEEVHKLLHSRMVDRLEAEAQAQAKP
jgi:hypothetical protein